MPRELCPSSYLCDCGHQSDFFEHTIREIKAMSRKKKIRLGDSDSPEHTIVFYKGETIDIICPHQQPEGTNEQQKYSARSQETSRSNC